MNGMNTFQREPAFDPRTDADIRRALEECGWRYTRQRAAVLACLHASTAHPTAEQVFATVRQQLPHISLATVYKALETLVDAGLAHRIAGDHGPTRYDGRSEPHYHLRCQHSGEVLDLPLAYDPSLVDKLDPQLIESLRRQGFEITEHRLELVGRMIRPEAAN
jgi:Fur family peroxide stress response transcriptional regulator